MSSVHNVDGELPETLGSIKSVTDSQEAVMSFYYTDAANQVGVSTHFFVGKFLTCPTLCLSQVKVMEIFDVTQTDPSLLVSDSMGIQYSMDDQVLLSHFSSFSIISFARCCPTTPSPVCATLAAPRPPLLRSRDATRATAWASPPCPGTTKTTSPTCPCPGTTPFPTYPGFKSTKPCPPYPCPYPIPLFYYPIHT